MHTADVQFMGGKKYTFEWDGWNVTHLWGRHQVRPFEAEEAMKDVGALIIPDMLHSGRELRYLVLGKTKKQRLLSLAFTVRKGHIRVLHARDASRKEARLYEEEISIT